MNEQVVVVLVLAVVGVVGYYGYRFIQKRRNKE